MEDEEMEDVALVAGENVQVRSLPSSDDHSQMVRSNSVTGKGKWVLPEVAAPVRLPARLVSFTLPA
eukprot:63086-Hanusia_phi.AAC.2